MSTLATNSTSHGVVMAMMSTPIDSASKIWSVTTVAAIYLRFRSGGDSRSKTHFHHGCVICDGGRGRAPGTGSNFF